MSVIDTERVAGQVFAIHAAELGRLSNDLAAKAAEITRLKARVDRLEAMGRVFAAKHNWFNRPDDPNEPEIDVGGE